MRLCGEQFTEVGNATGRRDFRGRKEVGLGDRLSFGYLGNFGWKKSRACQKGETSDILAGAVKPDHMAANSSSSTSQLSGQGKEPGLTEPQSLLSHMGASAAPTPSAERIT